MGVGDAVRHERQRDGGLEQADVPGPEREDRRDVHEQEDEAGGGERLFDAEGVHRRPDGGELEEPPHALAEHGRAGGEWRPQHAEAVPRHHHVLADAAELASDVDRVPPRRHERDSEQYRPECDDDHERRHGPRRDPRLHHHVEDEERHRDEVEDAVGEDRPRERRPEAATGWKAALEHADPENLAGARGQHRVAEEPDPECGEDVAEPRVRRRHRLVDDRPPRDRAHEHRQKVEDDGEERPAPVDGLERFGDHVPARPAPPEREHRGDEGSSGEHRAHPARVQDADPHATALTRVVPVTSS